MTQFKQDSRELSISYHDFFSKTKSERILHFCFSSDYFQRQKNDLISRIASIDSGLDKKKSLNYVCLGKSMSENNNALTHVESREMQFKYSAEQRNLISDQKTELNIQNFTKFSLTYDVLSLAHHNDIKKLGIFDLSSETEPQSDPASFILYNCARLHAIIEKFENLQNDGISF